jgi:hypothetical protein
MRPKARRLRDQRRNRNNDKKKEKTRIREDKREFS